MARRILISGGTIISSDPSETAIAGVAPVDCEVRLYQHPEDEDYYRYNFDARGGAEMRCRIQIVGDDQGAADTAFQDIEAILKRMRSRNLEFERTAGTRRWQMPVQFTEGVDVIAECVATGRAYRIDCRFLTQGIGADGGDDDVADGAVSPITWTPHFGPGGLCTMRGVGTFESKAKAVAWVTGIEAGTVPPWHTDFGDDFTFYRWEGDYAQKPGSYTGSQLFTVTLEMRQQISGLVDNAKLSLLRDFAFTTVKHDGSTNTTRGGEPPLDLSIGGVLQFKTEKLDSFRSGDSIVTARDVVLDQADEAIDVILADLDSRMPFTVHELRRKVEFDEREGFCNFGVELTMPENDKDELNFFEQITLRYDPNSIDAERSDGSTKTWTSPAGMRVYLDHTLKIRSFKQPVYKTPVVANPARWTSRGGQTNVPEPEKKLHRNGLVIYNLDAETHWKRKTTGESDVVAPPKIDKAITPADLY